MPGHVTGQTIAITGAAGFIGGRLVDRLAAEPCTIIRVARGAMPPLINPVATVIDVAGDLSQRDVWDPVVDADVIVHLAAQTSNAVAAADPDGDYRANVVPMHHLLSACQQRGRRPLVLFAGSATEAGVQRRMQLTELAEDDPVTIYDRHKLMAEQALKAAASAGAVQGATLRLSNVYGPGSQGRRADRDVLNRMIGAALIGQPLTFYGTGEYVRDYVFVDDVVEAFLAAARHRDELNGRHFVIGSGVGVAIRDAFKLIAERVEHLTGRPVEVRSIEPPVPLSALDCRNVIVVPSEFSHLTGWHPEFRHLRDGIDRTIEALICV